MNLLEKEETPQNSLLLLLPATCMHASTLHLEPYLSLVGFPTRCDLCPETEYRNALIYRWPTHQHYYPFYPTT